jgi:Zn-finger nucleic acid-binding protein
MKCPVDDTELRITDRQGVEVDYCPVCRGVWLDRGELDKIIQRAARDDDRDDDDRVSRSRDRDDRPYRDERRPDDRDYRPEEPKKKRRRSLLEDLFDFD